VVVVYCSHLLLLELWSACSGFVRTIHRRGLASLISAAEPPQLARTQLEVTAALPGGDHRDRGKSQAGSH
jgi:hypothetical protein